jgi:hypothetical protein
MKTNSHSHFKALKFTMIKLCLFTFLFQVTNAKAQNPTLLEHDWYFEIGSINNETFTIPEVPNDFPINSPFESMLDFNINNGNISFYTGNNFCSMALFAGIEFLDTENTFEIVDNGYLTGGCDFAEAGIFLDIIMYFYGIGYEQTPNPFNYNVEEVENYYRLTITNNDGDWLVYNSVLLSNPEFNESSVSLYPNPVQNILNIQNTASNLSKVQIYDLNGRLLQNHALQTNEVSLDVSQLTSGVYLVVLENEMGNRITRKIMKTTK